VFLRKKALNINTVLQALGLKQVKQGVGFKNFLAQF
jgi:hypothetical protein